MADIARIVARIEAGEKASFDIDYYGKQTVVFRPRLLFWRRERIALTAREEEAIKQALRDRRRSRRKGKAGQPSVGAPVDSVD